LEAAHIVRYTEAGSQDVRNGLLLRADIHTLFDLGLLRIDPESRKIVLDESIRATCYAEFEGRQLRGPAAEASRPSHENLLKRWAYPCVMNLPEYHEDPAAD
jgi:predicted restriction endonuclease